VTELVWIFPNVCPVAEPWSLQALASGKLYVLQPALSVQTTQVICFAKYVHWNAYNVLIISTVIIAIKDALFIVHPFFVSFVLFCFSSGRGAIALRSPQPRRPKRILEILYGSGKYAAYGMHLAPLANSSMGFVRR